MPLWDIAFDYLNLKIVFDDPTGKLKDTEARNKQIMDGHWKFDIKADAAVFGFHPHGIIPYTAGFMMRTPAHHLCGALSRGFSPHGFFI